MDGLVDAKKPVVVFVRDQLASDANGPRYSPGGASLTDSGRGNSDDCGEDHSTTPSMSSTSPRHDVNSESTAVRPARITRQQFPRSIRVADVTSVLSRLRTATRFTRPMPRTKNIVRLLISL